VHLQFSIAGVPQGCSGSISKERRSLFSLSRCLKVSFLSLIILITPPVALLAAVQFLCLDSGLVFSLFPSAIVRAVQYPVDNAFDKEGILQFLDFFPLLFRCFSRNHIFCSRLQQMVEFLIARLHVGGLFPRLFRLYNQRMCSLGVVTG
jgi:hypothetical protein